MTETRILTLGDALAIPADADVAHWNVGRSGDLGAGVEVWTSWLPVQGVYETLVILPQALEARWFQTFTTTTQTTHTRDAAFETHRLVVSDVQAWLAAVGR